MNEMMRLVLVRSAAGQDLSVKIGDDDSHAKTSKTVHEDGLGGVQVGHSSPEEKEGGKGDAVSRLKEVSGYFPETEHGPTSQMPGHSL